MEAGTLRVGSWNIRSLTGKSIELLKIINKRTTLKHILSKVKRSTHLRLASELKYA